MDTENFSSLESDGLSQGTEAPSEKSEKQKESYKKAQAQLQKSQKDEKKAKGDNDELFTILSRFIQNPYYESLIPFLTNLLKDAVPSRFIIALIALFYPEATLHMLSKIEKSDKIHELLSLHRYSEPTVFHEANLHETIRTWMSTWVNTSKQYLTESSFSITLKKKLHEFLSDSNRGEEALLQIFAFFFETRNLTVKSTTLKGYASFLRKEYADALAKSLVHDDQSFLLSDEELKTSNLFGLE